MANGYTDAVLALCALFGLATAWMSGMQPARFAEQLGLSVANAGGLNEVRAQYAGFFLAAALVCIAALAGIIPRQAALILLIATFGGLFCGRLVSLAINRGTSGFSPAIISLYFIDFTGLALASVALAFGRR